MSLINTDGVRPQRWRSRAANRAGMPFPDVLRQLREAYDISQSKFAAKVGLDHSTISRLEIGDRKPGPDALAVLADEFGLAGQERFQFFASAGRFEEAPDAEKAQMMALISVMDDDELRAVRAILAWEMGRQKRHTFAGNGTIESVQIERPGGAANTPDPATKE